MDITHKVFNQPEPLVNYNLFEANRPLRDALKFNAPARDLPPAAGESVPAFHLEITADQIVRFCGASDDYGALHWDHLWMVEHGYDGVIAQGWLTCSVMLSAATSWPVLSKGRVREYEVKYLRPNPPSVGVTREQGPCLRCNVPARSPCSD